MKLKVNKWGGGWNGGTLISDIWFFRGCDIWYLIFLGFDIWYLIFSQISDFLRTRDIIVLILIIARLINAADMIDIATYGV